MVGRWAWAYGVLVLRLCVLLVAGVVLAGCAGSTKTEVTTTTTVSMSDQIRVFKARVNPVTDRMSEALMWIGGAAQSMDLTDTRAGCRQLDTDVDSLRALLPAPTPALTSHLQDAVDSFREYVFICQGLSPSTTKAEFGKMSSYQKAAMGALSDAYAIMNTPPGS